MTATGGNAQPNDIVLERTLRRIEIFSQAGDDWKFAQSLKSVSEDTAQEYEGRAVLELVQNGHDPLPLKGRGKISVLLDLREPEGFLYVANEGEPFQVRNFRAITEPALSDKGAGEGIGNKGLGFRSVQLLTDWPEIYSKSRASASSYDGFCFRFARSEDLRRLIPDSDLRERVEAQVSPLDLPVPAAVEDPVLEDFAAQGYSTVIRLPLRNAAAAIAARAQVESLLVNEAPLLLFLDRVGELSVEVRNFEGEPKLGKLTRHPGPCHLVAALEHDWIEEVDLGGEGRYLLARQKLAVAPLKAAIELSVEALEIDKKWREWDGEDAWVGIALRLDSDILSGRLYTFLPMSDLAPSPLAAHAHAPFFTKLARSAIRDSVALNDYLLRQLAHLSVQLLRRLRQEAPHQVAARFLADLACWEPSDRLVACMEDTLADEPLVPLLGTDRWGTLKESYDWPTSPHGWAVLTADAIASLGVDVLDISLINDVRHERLTRLHQTLLETVMTPTTDVIAEWAEGLAAQLRPPGGSGPTGNWPGFYNDIAHALREEPSALQGRKVVLDQDGQLRRALGKASPNERDETVFFSPGEGTSDLESPRVPRDLKALRRRIAFTHPDIAWERTGRAFLENNQLVREYRADRVFDALKELLSASSSDALRRDALAFTFRQFNALTPSQRDTLKNVGLFVPRTDGSWSPAGQSLLSPAWGRDGARRLKRFFDAGGDTIEELANLRQRWIMDPEQWPTDMGDDTSAYADYLLVIGVRDGLLLFTLQGRFGERNGGELVPKSLAAQAKLPDPLAEAWSNDVASNWEGGSHPWTKYTFAQPLVYIPGAVDVANLNALARREFAELILYGFLTWKNHSFNVTVWRPTRPYLQQDPHTWPTPLASFLRHLPWVPMIMSNGAVTNFVRPDQAWISAGGDPLPPFVTAMPLSFRRMLTGARPLQLMQSSGLRLWEDPRFAGAVVVELGDALSEGTVPEHLSIVFKNQYMRALADAARQGVWPWKSAQHVRLATLSNGRLDAITPTGNDSIYVPDEEALLKESLVESAGHPVLVCAPETGGPVFEFLDAHEVRAARLSTTQVQIRSGEEPVNPGSEWSLLCEGREWLVTLIALVMELKSGPFRRRRGDRGLRELMERVRSIRLARISDVDVLIDGRHTRPLPTTRSLPLFDPDHPTLAVWDAVGYWDELQACASAATQLLRQPELHDALELALIKLQRMLGGEAPEWIDDQSLGLALDVPARRVEEVRRSVAGQLTDLVRGLRPLLAYLTELAGFDGVEESLQAATSEEDLLTLLAPYAEELTLSPGDVLACLASGASHEDLRDSLALDFGRFNAALIALGPPYAPILHSELHEREFDAFVGRLSALLVDRLREYYAPLAEQGLDISRYAAGRRFADLIPDPDWLPLSRVPSEEQMRVQAAAWLHDHGANADFEAPSALPPVEELRGANLKRLEDAVILATPRVTAWLRLHGLTPMSSWSGAPAMEATVALEATGLADLIELSYERLLRFTALTLGWPLGMPVTLDLLELGLDDKDLEAQAGKGPETDHPRPPEPSPTTITVGGTEVLVGLEHLLEIAEAAFRTVDDAFLGQTGKTTLAEVQSSVGTGRTSGGIGRRIVVARQKRMSEDERSGCGFGWRDSCTCLAVKAIRRRSMAFWLRRDCYRR